VKWVELRSPLVRTGFLVLLLAGVPWSTGWRQVRLLWDTIGPARAFLAEVQRVTAGAAIYSEDLRFFETRYQGEIIDMGDIVSHAATAEYYGEAFDATVQRHYAELQAHPPKFVMLGEGVRVVSPSLSNLIAQSYVPLLHAPEHLWANPGGGAVLFQLRSSLPALRTP
jgi:hypothetical protein